MDVLKQLVSERKTKLDGNRRQITGKKYVRRGDMKNVLPDTTVNSESSDGAKAKKDTESASKRLQSTNELSNDTKKETQSSTPTYNKRRRKNDAEENVQSPEVDQLSANDPVARQETIQRLRKYGQVVTFFGESDIERMKRLRQFEAEMGDDLALSAEYSDFSRRRSKANDPYAGSGMQEKKTKMDTQTGTQQTEQGDTSADNSIRTAMDIAQYRFCPDDRKWSEYKFVYKFWRQLMKEWEDKLQRRDSEQSCSASGREESKLFQQCKDYMKPFLRMCRNKELPADILEFTVRMAEFCLKREYRLAVNEYVQLAIGNSPWPIGVTGAGIHERASRTRLSTHNVAHVLNDEQQRKYITTIKRLITLCQELYPTDPSKMFVS